MIDPEFLERLRCPETRQTVREAGAELLGRLNAKVASGELRTRSGKPVEQTLEAGLVREDGRVLYPIRHQIPVMLVEESIEVADLTPAGNVPGEERHA